MNVVGNKILVVCGPTATGKTNLAFYMSEKFRGEIISADSRQVYVGMDIGTGKDLSKSAVWHKGKGNIPGYYSLKKTRLWGHDLASPKKGFSIAEYVGIISKVIRDVRKREKLPILVGGSGFYIKGIVDGIDTMDIPQDVFLRKNLMGKGRDELFEMLSRMDPIKAASMNISDRNNSRRLIRAIEVAKDGIGKKQVNRKGFIKGSDILFIGINIVMKKLEKIIERRVDNRVKAGMEKEMISLIKNGMSWKMQAMNTLGYKEWEGYFDGKITKKEVIATWKTNEKRYAKRQMTWFKKDKRIEWFNADEDNMKNTIENRVQEWYSSNR